MAKRHYMFLLLVCLIGIFLISTASAGDLNETSLSQIDDVAGVGEIDQTQEISETGESEELGATDLENLSTDYAPSSSPEIQTDINNANDGDTIILDGYYLLNSTINVNKKLNFVGINDATIDGNNTVMLLNVSSSGVTFKNITFKNGYAENGGAIYSTKVTKAFSVDNCIFINNTASSNGGAILFTNGGSVVGCSFVGNFAGDRGGAVYGGSFVNCSFVGNSAGNRGGAAHGSSVVNCSFVNNTAKIFGGAIYDGSVVGCSFVGNSATSNDGGAVYFYWRGSVVNCSFVGNFAGDRGGDVFGGVISVVNCSFVNNTAKRGGAIYITSDGSVVGCSFVNNSAKENGGAVYFNDDGSVVGCSFVNNTSKIGGAIWVYEGSVLNCSFVGNSAGDRAGAVFRGLVVNCSFVDNYARCGGATVSALVRNCSFINNHAEEYGGAMNGGSAVNCNFINNSVTAFGFYGGGAMWGGSAVNCSFVNNSANCMGGAMWDGSALNCSFVNNTANSWGGAISFSYDGSIVNCTFNNCFSKSGAICLDATGIQINITNCSFENCNYNNYDSITLRYSGDYYVLDTLFDVIPSTIICHYTSKLIVSNESYMLIANLSDIRGQLSNETITLTFNDKKYNFTTDSNGLVYIKVNDYLLEPGNHTVTIDFAGDYRELPSSVNVNVTILPIKLTVNDLEIFKGEKGALIANLSDNKGSLSNKTVSFSVNGGIVNVTTDGEGIAVLNVTDYLTISGNYTILVSFAGDDESYPVSANASVVIKKHDSLLTVDGITIYKGEIGKLLAYLSDSRGMLSNETVSFSVNGGIVNVTTDGEGIAVLNVTDYLTIAGKYVVDVIFEGDEFDKPSSAIVNVTINKYDSTLTAKDLNIFNDENVSLATYLSDLRGALYNKTVVFTVDDIDYNVTTDLNGFAYFEVTKYLSEGKYTVTIAFAGDEFDKPSTTTANVTINRYDSVLTANNLVIFKDEDDCVIANLSDIRGPLAGKKITFMVNNVKFEVTTNSSGLASFDINSYLDEGNYTLYISFAGDEFDKPSSTNVTVILKKYDSLLIVNDLSMVVGDGDLLVANLSNIRGPISKKSIIFTVNNQNIPRTTSSLGIASLKISDYLQTVGKYVVRVSFAGDDANDPVSVNASVLISNYKGNLSVVQNGKYYGDTSLTFKLVDLKNNNPVGYASINVAFSNGRTVSLTTDSNGLANYVVPFEPGTYNFTAGVTSPNVDVNTLEITNLTINKIVGEIQITHEDYSKTLKIKLANPQNGDVYRNILVTLEFSNGEVVPVTTNDEGIFVYEMPFTPDTYYVIASVTGDYMEFEVAELDNIIISDKDNSIIKIYDDIIFDYGKSGSTTISVINGRVLQENIAVIDHPEANITLNNNEIIVSNLTVGTYTLRVVTTPDEGYNAVVGTKHIIVNGIYSSVDIHNNIEFDYSKSGSTTVDVEGGRIGNVTIDGNPHGAVINLTGNMITVSGLDAGTYTLRVTSSPDANHKSVDGTAYINVRKINGEVNISDMVFDYGQSGYTTVYVEGGSIDQFNIKIIGHEDIVPQLNGNILTVSGLDADTYVLSVTSTPDRNHYPATGQANIVVNRVKSSVELSGNISFDYLGSNSIFALVSGGVVEYDNITIDGNPKEAKITFDNNIISISGLNAGTYTLRVKSSPDKNHLADEQTAMITVNRIASSISFGSKSIVFDYLKSGSVTVAVVGGNVLESGLSVVDHPEVKPTIKDNRITLSGLNVGMYTLRVENAPNGNYRSDVKFINITVNKVSAAIKVKAIALYYKEGKKWTIKLIDTKTGKGIANMVIKLKVFTGKKSKTYSVKTNSKGVATFKNLKKLSVGKHKVTLSFSKYGYNCKSLSKTVKVLKQTKVEYTVKSVPRKDGTSVSIWIKTGKKPIKKGVKFNIYVPKRKKPVTVVTGTFNKVNKGFVGYGTNLLSAGTHKITIKPVGFKYKGSKTIKIKIKKGVNKYKKSETIISKGKLQTILN